MGLVFDVIQGAARDFALQLSYSSQSGYTSDAFAVDPELTSFLSTAITATTPATTFLSGDVLTCSVWQGQNETSVLSPAIGWITASLGTFLTTFQNADTQSLAYGQYYIQAFATRAGSPSRTVQLLPVGSSLVVAAAPGTTFAARPTYISITDVRNIAPWIDDLTIPQNDSGFDNQLADARDWLDELIVRNYRGGNVSLLGYHGFALDAWYTGGGRRTSLTNRWLYQALQANQLLIRPRVKQICAYYALSRICESLITKSGQYIGLAARFRFEAESLLASSTVEIDVNNDGFGEVPINFSSTNTLWA
jgi:hypothetical protein